MIPCVCSLNVGVHASPYLWWTWCPAALMFQPGSLGSGIFAVLAIRCCTSLHVSAGLEEETWDRSHDQTQPSLGGCSTPTEPAVFRKGSEDCFTRLKAHHFRLMQVYWYINWHGHAVYFSFFFYIRSSEHKSTCLSQAHFFNNGVTKNCESNKDDLRLLQKSRESWMQKKKSSFYSQAGDF